MVYQIKDTVGQKNITHEILLVFDDNLSLDSIQTDSCLIIMGILLTYIIFLMWSIRKDRQKEVYAPNVENKIKGGFQIRPDAMKKVDMDYTNETIDITTITTEDVRQYSNMISTEGDSGTPVQAANKVFRFESTGKKDETSDDQTSKIEGKSSLVNLDISEIKGADQTMNMNHIVSPLSDESIFRSTKRESRRRGPPTAVVRQRETIQTKFWRLLAQRHIIVSTKQRMSRISPRWKRVGLLYFLFLLDMFLASISCIDLSLSNHPITTVLSDSLIAWCCFGLISRLSSVSKDKLKDSLSTQDFQDALYNLESESKVKTIFIHFLIFVFAVFTYIQIGLFTSNYTSQRLSWILTTLLVFLIQVGVIEILWTLFLSALYIKAYESRLFKRAYKILNLCRFWRI